MDRKFFEIQGFLGFKTISSLRETGFREIPDRTGVYCVLTQSQEFPRFLLRSTGGHFRGVDPTREIQALKDKWIRDTQLIYIGESHQRTLRRRIGELIAYGDGKPVGHSGGSALWQIEGSGELLVCWKIVRSDRARTAKQAIIDSFKESYRGKLPFANQRNAVVASNSLSSDLLDAMAKKIAENVDPNEIYVFGSYARGTADKNSDIDLLIVVDPPYMQKYGRREVLRAIRRSLASFDYPKDLLVFSSDEFSRYRHSPGHIAQQAFQEGERLYVRQRAN
jgi:predicted nucleotidyltransferase